MAWDNPNDLYPPAPPGYRNVKWQAWAKPTNPGTPRFVSAYVPDIVSGGALLGVIELQISNTSPGQFQVEHGLGVTPALVILQMTSDGEVWLSPNSWGALYDETYIYLDANAGGLTCTALIWMTGATVEIPLAPTSPGPFQVPHGLGATPALVLIQMTSGDEIWLTPNSWGALFDDTYIYLDASTGGATGNAVVWLARPYPVVVESTELSLAPTSPGPFQIAHGLSITPDLVVVQMTSEGEIWLQTPISCDETYIYLEASAGGITGIAEVWASGSPNSSSSSPTFVDNEVVSFSGTSGTLAGSPVSGSQHLFKNGIRQTPGEDNDYTISGADITLLVAAVSGDQFICDYRK